MRINPMSFFRAGSYILIIGAMVHLIGHFWLTGNASPEEKELMQLMAGFEKKIVGGSLAMLDILHGLNVCYSLFFIFAGSINLFLVHHTADLELLKKVSYINASACGLGIIISLIYFYWVPVLTFTSIMACFTLAGVYIKHPNKSLG